MATTAVPDVEDQWMLSGVQSIEFSCFDGSSVVGHLGHHRGHVGEHQSARGRPRADSNGREQSGHHATD